MPFGGFRKEYQNGCHSADARQRIPTSIGVRSRICYGMSYRKLGSKFAKSNGLHRPLRAIANSRMLRELRRLRDRDIGGGRARNYEGRSVGRLLEVMGVTPATFDRGEATPDCKGTTDRMVILYATQPKGVTQFDLRSVVISLGGDPDHASKIW